MAEDAGLERLQHSRQLEVREDHYCFGCGRLNPHGLHLSFYADERDDSVWSEWTPAREQQGFADIAHGGMIATVLDEVMGWMISSKQIWAVTGTIEVAFRKPVQIGVPTIARAWISSESGRKIGLKAEIRQLDNDRLLADADSIFVRVSPAIAADWQRRYVGGESGSSAD